MFKIFLFIFISIILAFLYSAFVVSKRADEWSHEDDSRT